MIEMSCVLGGKGLWRLRFVCINEDNGGSAFTLSHLEKICSRAF